MLITLKALNNFTALMREEVAERCSRRHWHIQGHWREWGTYSQRCAGTLFPSSPLEKASFLECNSLL